MTEDYDVDATMRLMTERIDELTEENRLLKDALKKAEKLAETSKGYPTDVSIAISKLVNK